MAPWTSHHNKYSSGEEVLCRQYIPWLKQCLMPLHNTQHNNNHLPNNQTVPIPTTQIHRAHNASTIHLTNLLNQTNMVIHCKEQLLNMARPHHRPYPKILISQQIHQLWSHVPYQTRDRFYKTWYPHHQCQRNWQNPFLHQSNKHPHNLNVAVWFTNLIASDLPGQFPITSVWGYKYLFLLYNVDDNYIQAILLKSWHTEELIRGFQTSYCVLTQHNFHTNTIWHDSKFSQSFISKDLKDQQLNIQLESKGNHWTNPSECAIHTSSPSSAAQTQNSQPTVGISSSHKPSSP